MYKHVEMKFLKRMAKYILEYETNFFRPLFPTTYINKNKNIIM